LVGPGHPQVEVAGVEVAAEAAGVGAGRAAADAVRVQRVPAGVEPPHPAGLVLPKAVQVCLYPRHPVTLPGLHLGGRPVDGVDLGPGADAAEEVIAGTAVALEEPVAFDVVDDAAVPAQSLFPVEVPPHDQAAAPTQAVLCPGRDGPGLDVRVVDD